MPAPAVVIAASNLMPSLCDRLAGEVNDRIHAIERVAVVALRRARDLQGCTFDVETRAGIVYLKN